MNTGLQSNTVNRWFVVTSAIQTTTGSSVSFQAFVYLSVKTSIYLEVSIIND